MPFTPSSESQSPDSWPTAPPASSHQNINSSQHSSEPSSPLIAHGGKTAARAAVTPSPEPFSNITLSLGEDVLAIGLTWLATRHPYIAGTLAALLIVMIVLLTKLVIRAMRALFRGAEHQVAA